MSFLRSASRALFGAKHSKRSSRRHGGGGASSASERRHVAAKMMHWHSGQHDPVYAVASFWIDGKAYPNLDIVRRARTFLLFDLTKAKKRQNGWGPAEESELQSILAVLDNEIGEATPTANAIGAMLDDYMDAALKTSTDESTPSGGYPLDKNYSLRDFTTEARAKMKRDVAKFAKANAGDIAGNWGQAGTDFWLSRNGHGTGFQDRDHVFGKEAAERLQQAARRFGESYVYVSRKKIHVDR